MSRVVEQTARDDQALDLAGTFVDVRDATIAHPLLEQQLAGDADGSEDLDASLSDLANGGARDTALYPVRPGNGFADNDLQQCRPNDPFYSR